MIYLRLIEMYYVHFVLRFNCFASETADVSWQGLSPKPAIVLDIITATMDRMTSRLSEVIVEVEVNGLEVEVVTHAQSVELLVLVWNAVLLQCLAHVEVAAVVLPRVAASV